MSLDEAMKHNVGEAGLVDDAARDQYKGSFENLKNRPDWDGKLTLSEANDWYRNGNGESLFTDINSLDLSGAVAPGPKSVGEKAVLNMFKVSNNADDQRVYGSITVKYFPNDFVRAYADEYDFRMQPWTSSSWKRNIKTIVGGRVAGEGMAYNIFIYGSAKLKPKQQCKKR